MEIINHQNTKIVATVGPACSDYDTLLQLVKSGVDVFRLNFSHGTHEDHQTVIERICYINDKYNIHIGILADLQGPKIRVGKIKDNKLEIKENDVLTFVNKECIGTKEKIYISYQSFASDVNPGDRILLDDGKIVLEVINTDKKTTVKLKVIHGTILSSNKGVNLPDTNISLPCLTKKDRKDLKFIFTQPVHWIALSFVRKAEDIIELLKLVEEQDHPAKVIAKIEKPDAVRNIDEIIKYSNGIMIARGDLGVEMPIEQIPSIQKQIIKKCIQRARPVIVATQMMESMITNINPTRAEVTDVANAVLDGTDAVMLSGETSIGKFPIKVVEFMNRIIDEAEKIYEIKGIRPNSSIKSTTFYSDVICFNAARTAEEIEAKALVALTVSGYTAFKLSSFRPNNKIYIFSDRHYMLSCLNLVWGVRCFYYDRFTTTDETIRDVAEILKVHQLLKTGDLIVNLGSMPIEKRFRTNMLKITIID